MRRDFFLEGPTICRLAVSDFWHERALSAVQVLSLTAVLTPVLVLLGLKYGFVDVLKQRLLETPSIREVRPIGSGAFPKQWFETMGKRPDVAFVVPRTRSIAATMTIRATRDSKSDEILTAELIPTGVGDPALKDTISTPLSDNEVVLSENAAIKLGVSAGESIRATARRKRNGRYEAGRLKLHVVAVAPNVAFERIGLFATPELLAAVEAFRDGYGSERFGWPGAPPPNRDPVFASYRLYAAELEQVAELRRLLSGQGQEVHTRSSEIEAVLAIDRSLTVIFSLIVTFVAAGYAFALSSGLWALILRKRAELSTLRLLGCQSPALAMFPLTHAWLTSVTGAALASVCALLLAATLNHLFDRSDAPGELICQITPTHLFSAVALTLATATFASLVPAARGAIVEPAESFASV